MSERFRTSAQRTEEDIRREQGMPAQAPGGNLLGTLGTLGLLNSLSQSSGGGSFLGSLFPSSSPTSTLEAIGTSMQGGPMMGPPAEAVMQGMTPSGFPLSGIGSAGNYIAPLAGGLGLYDALSNDREGLRGYLQSGLSGAALGSYFGPAGAAIGAGLGLVGKLGQDLFGSKKPRLQRDRDTLRSFLEGQGFLSRNEQGSHISPSGFNYGADGGNRLTNEAGQTRRTFEVDFSDPRASQTAALLDPLGTMFSYQSGIGGEQRTNSVGLLVNDVLSQGGDTRSAALDMYRRSGMSPDQILQGIGELGRSGKLTPDQVAVFSNTVNSLSSPGATMGGGGISLPSAPPQIDLSMLKTPQDPMANIQNQRQGLPVYNKSLPLNLFPTRKEQGQRYQPLLALGG